MKTNAEPKYFHQHWIHQNVVTFITRGVRFSDERVEPCPTGQLNTVMRFIVSVNDNAYQINSTFISFDYSMLNC